MVSTLAPSTQRNYCSCFRTYVNFSRSNNLKALPLHEFNLMLFSTSLAQSSFYSNVKLHLAAIKHYAILYNHNSNVPPYPRLYMLLRAIKRRNSNKHNSKKRTPITPSLLLDLKSYLQTSHHSPQDRLMLWCVFTCAFFGFLRSSEFVSPTIRTFDPNSTLLYNNIRFNCNRAELELKSSKTDPFRQGCKIRLSHTPNQLCPVAALKDFLPNHPSQTCPLFTYENDIFLTRRRLAAVLDTAIPNTTDSRISTHSFRIAVATTATLQLLPR